MAKIGIISPPTLGHVNPFLILGSALIKRGHDVVFFQQIDMKDKIEKAGIRFCRLGKSLPLDSIKNVQQELGNRHGLNAMRFWMKQQIGLFKLWFVDLPKLVDLEKVDYMLVDQSDPVGACVAEYKNIPFITVCMGLDLDWEEEIPPFFLDWEYGNSEKLILRNKIGFKNFVKDFQPLFDYVNKKREEYKIPSYDYTKTLYPVSPIAQIAQLPEFLDYPRKHKSVVFHNVGPFVENTNAVEISFPYEKLNRKPLVYISLGTILNMRSDLFEMIGESFSDINAQLVISTGNKLSAINTEILPEDSVICDYVPQRKVLERAVLCITHGGLNTVMDALSNGVPVLVIPISFDQPGTAARIKYKKVGEYIRYNALSKEVINETVKKIMNDPGYYERSGEMKRAFSELNGLETAISIIEKNIIEKKIKDNV
ncbi:glycosyltransferase [Flavobacterium chilense]|uniref:Glycosyltransferase, MGT family n=1 Tax=Flavobacterium chilense TaxID=946677 RepID=A0A1M7MWD8_9FLAO|nr:glycosyltransferase [Flavobacterium chilense]SHM95498.1 glycosyltransferase, MGT family [Flavobacterium chilense]